MTVWSRFRRLFVPPVFEVDEDKTRAASLLSFVLSSVFLLVVFVAISAPLIFPVPALGVGIAVGVELLVVLLLYLVRRGQVRFVSIVTVCALWIGYTVLVLASGGVTSVFVSGYAAAVVAAGLLLGGIAAVVVAGLSILSGIAMAYVESTGILVPSMVFLNPGTGALTLAANVAMMAVMLYLASSALQGALRRVRGYAAEVDAQRRQLEGLVTERTRDLTRQTSYLGATRAVARVAASLMSDPQQLLVRVAGEIGEQFGFYHVGIFLVDPSGEWVELRAASSEGGQRMLERRHRLRVGQGIVGYVASRGLHRIALEVGEDEAFLANPNLSETRSEVALPLRSRGETVGVLDVQSQEPGAFSEDDVATLQTLADQVTLAITNAQLFRQVEEGVEEARRAYSMLSGEAWREFLHADPDLGFVSDGQVTAASGDLWRPEMRVALQEGQITASTEDVSALAIPITVRGQVIGVVDGRKRDGKPWMAEERTLLQAMTAELSVALEGARLYRDAQARAAREQLTFQIADQVRGALDVEEIMRVAARSLGRELNASEVVVRLGSERRLLGESDARGTLPLVT
jgi:GAF domain-containing protein